MHGGQRALGGLAVDVEQDQRLAGVVVVDGRLVQPDDVGDVVHPGAVVAAGGEQLGGNGQQLLAPRQPVGVMLSDGISDSLSSLPAARMGCYGPVRQVSINWLDSLGNRTCGLSHRRGWD